MIILRIKEKGHLIDIPNRPPFRTPAEIDISKGDIRAIVGYLKVYNIQDYEIIASTKDTKEIYKAEDFNPPKKKAIEKAKKKPKQNKKLEKRVDRMEKILEKLYEKTSDDSGKNVEQINDLEQFRKDILGAINKINVVNVPEKTVSEEVEDESVQPFIPEIDTEGMKIRSQGKHKTLKRDTDTDDAADALSKLLK